MIVIIVPSLFYSYMFCKWEIVRVNGPANSTIYHWNLTESNLDYENYIEMGVMLLRDGIGLIILVTMNIVLLLKVLK